MHVMYKCRVDYHEECFQNYHLHDDFQACAFTNNSTPVLKTEVRGALRGRLWGESQQQRKYGPEQGGSSEGLVSNHCFLVLWKGLHGINQLLFFSSCSWPLGEDSKSQGREINGPVLSHMLIAGLWDRGVPWLTISPKLHSLDKRNCPMGKSMCFRQKVLDECQ